MKCFQSEKIQISFQDHKSLKFCWVESILKKRHFSIVFLSKFRRKRALCRYLDRRLRNFRQRHRPIRRSSSSTRGQDSTQPPFHWSPSEKGPLAHAFYKRCIFKIARGFLNYDPVLRQQLSHEEGRPLRRRAHRAPDDPLLRITFVRINQRTAILPSPVRDNDAPRQHGSFRSVKCRLSPLLSAPSVDPRRSFNY
jgi:hypothetical protein